MGAAGKNWVAARRARFVGERHHKGWSLGWRLPAVCAALAACQPEIGSDCESNAECSVTESRDCDRSLPGGYCTVLNCGPGDCPEEAVCVAYRATISVVEACQRTAGRRRLQRTACMRTCSSSQDCRSGYECVGLAPGNPWAAEVVDTGRGDTVCSLAAPTPLLGEGGYCQSWSTGSGSLGPDAGLAR